VCLSFLIKKNAPGVCLFLKLLLSFPFLGSNTTGTAAGTRTCSGVSSSSAAFGVQGSGADGPSIGGDWSLDVAKVKCSCLYSSLDRRVYFFYPLIVC
jgi:hypothetical protein